MPQVKVTDAKGLFQQSGTGVVIQSKGLEGCVVSSETDIPVAVGTTDISFSMPAGALVSECGIVCTSALGGTGASGTVTIDFGTAAGGGQLVADAVVCDANSAMAAGASMSSSNLVKGDASGAAFANFADASALHSTAARTLYCRVEQKVGVAAAIGKVFAFIKYTIVA
jgi:hypothetical protein